MLDSLTPVLEHWYLYLGLLALIALFYILELKCGKEKKRIFTVLNLAAHAALIVLCLVFDAGTECALLLMLAAVLLGQLI